MASSLVDKLVQVRYFPDSNTFGLPDSQRPLPEWPFDCESPFWKTQFYSWSLNGLTPITIAFVYFTCVHLLNKVVLNRQISAFKAKNPSEKLPKNLKSLKAAPYYFATTRLFKVLVFVHNLFLCVYSVWTFIGMTSTIHHISTNLLPVSFSKLTYLDSSNYSKAGWFWQAICNSNDKINNLWTNYQDQNLKGLTYWAYLFYLSKYYEILDTVIILLKGRPSSLLQSYHHSGAILCMWSGTRYMSPPIWIFVVFNSFIHSLMYAYFTLSCVNIRLPKWFKQTLTTLQITQFVLGGSLALVHLFISYYDFHHQKYSSCISSSEEAIAVYINVFYLTPLTLLFAAFYVDSYKKKAATISSKKNA